MQITISFPNFWLRGEHSFLQGIKTLTTSTNDALFPSQRFYIMLSKSLWHLHVSSLLPSSNNLPYQITIKHIYSDIICKLLFCCALENSRRKFLHRNVSSIIMFLSRYCVSLLFLRCKNLTQVWVEGASIWNRIYFPTLKRLRGNISAVNLILQNFLSLMISFLRIYFSQHVYLFPSSSGCSRVNWEIENICKFSFNFVSQ